MTDLTYKIASLGTATILFFSPLQVLAEDIKKPFTQIFNYRSIDPMKYNIERKQDYNLNINDEYEPKKDNRYDFLKKIDKVELDFGNIMVKFEGKLGVSVLFVKRF